MIAVVVVAWSGDDALLVSEVPTAKRGKILRRYMMVEGEGGWVNLAKRAA